MARALVLGATGHIGAHVVRALLSAGHLVRAAYRTERFLSVLEGLPVERVRVDLGSLDGLAPALQGCEWVFHAAGYYPGFTVPRQTAVAIGRESSRRALQAIGQARPARVVFTSSAATIRRVPDRPADEGDAESPDAAETGRRGTYAAVKIAIEQEARRACDQGLPVVIVNPSFCIGEYDAHPFSGKAILLYARGRVPAYLDYTFNAVYTGDVGAGHVSAAERGRVGERYLLSCRNMTVKEFATMVARAAGVRPPLFQVPYGVVMAVSAVTEVPARLMRREPWLPLEMLRGARGDQVLDARKAIGQLALPQTPIEDAVRRAVAWFRAHGYLPAGRT